VDRREYVRGIVTALNCMAERMASVAPPFDPATIPSERAEAVIAWRRGLVSEVRTRAMSDIGGLQAPDDLASFHQSLVRCISDPDTDREPPPSWHASPNTEGWPKVMMRLALLSQEESVPFPSSKRRSQPAEPDPVRAPGDDWRTRVRRHLEIAGDPNPDEAIQELESLSEQE
jgi:hypothetical protein